MEINKVAVVSTIIDEMLKNIPDEELRMKGYRHLFGVSQTAVLLAMKRGLNTELAAIAGLLHDYTKYSENKDENHADDSANAVLPILARSGLFTVCEISVIVTAIQRHSDKEKVDSPYDELLKDADVFQHVLIDAGNFTKEKYIERGEKVKAELGIS